MPEAGGVEENASLQGELGSRFKCAWVIPKAALPASNGSNSGSSLAMFNSDGETKRCRWADF